MADLWIVKEGSSPIVATAIHDGHELREEVRERMVLPEADRLREEDPYTGRWAEIAPTRLIARRSRFEVDLNRAREKAVYRRPEDCWGLEVWNGELPEDVVSRSLDEYDAFYAEARRVIQGVVDAHGCAVILDLHTYNHRREGPDGPEADPETNPEVNIGTGSVDRSVWGNLVNGFMEDVRAYDFGGRHLDVRENVKFRGANFARWVHATWPGRACDIAIEFKKFFMDEWTGEFFEEPCRHITGALQNTLDGLRNELVRVQDAKA